MDSTIPMKCYALLVGIDMYLNDGSRKNGNGEPLFLRNLQGCVNDVRAMKEFLEREFQVNEPRVLTSSLPPNDTPSKEPVESPEEWPTFENIKHEFDTITAKATAGDFFFFHFSGHGAQLQLTDRSPKGRSVDPSLITMDYCNSRAAVRGWQLNEWLKRLNGKGVRIAVILDSCHAGGGWRTGTILPTGSNFRTTEGWENLPNNATDEAAIMETCSESFYRDSELVASWGIDPKGFTLMAACTREQQAEERKFEDEYHGVFTYTLLACLQQSLPGSKIITYSNLLNQVQRTLQRQTPMVYGQHRLLFLRSMEQFSMAPIIAKIDASTIILPLGRFHGVHVKSEFITHPFADVTFTINAVDDFECSATIQSPHPDISNQGSCEVASSRWSLGGESLRVFVHRDLGNSFRHSLHTAVEHRIVADTQVLDINDSINHNSLEFTLTRRDNSSLDIFGPSSLLGYEGPVRGVNITGDTNHELSVKSAIIIRHLTRFHQILALKNISSNRPAPFELTLVREDLNSTSDSRPKFRFKLRNTDGSQLFCTVLCLGPAFNVKQLYPTEAPPAKLNQEQLISFGFNISIPEELQSYSQQRDIIRTIVTRGKPLSWRALELPHIWHAECLEVKPQRNDSGRDATLSTDYCVWIHDECILV